LDRLEELAAKHHVPGAQVGLLALDSSGDADIRVLPMGLTSLSTKVEVTPETLFSTARSARCGRRR